MKFISIAKSILFILLIFGCASRETNITSTDIHRELNKLYNTANSHFGKSYGEFYIKYDLLNINSHEPQNCPVSELYLTIIAPGNIDYAAYIDKIESIKRGFENKAKSNTAKETAKLAKNWLKYLKRVDGTVKKASKKEINFKDIEDFDELFTVISEEIPVSHTTGENYGKIIKELLELDNRLKHIPIAAPIHKFKIISGFKMRKDPFTKKARMHYGVDLKGANNSIIYSTSKGTVEFSGTQKGYGNMVIINHGKGYTTRYAHLSKIFVEKGAPIYIFQPIGIQGSTGRSTSPHLHYEIRENNRAIDPANLIKLGANCRFKEQTH